MVVDKSGNLKKYVNDFYLSFSNLEIRSLRSMGWEAKKFIGYGSLSAATQFSKNVENTLRDILIVSS